MKKTDDKNLLSNQSHTPSLISKTWSKVTSLTNKITDIGNIIKKPQDNDNSGIVYILWDKSGYMCSKKEQSVAARQVYIMSAVSIEKGYKVGIINFDETAYETVKPTKDLDYIGRKIAVIEDEYLENGHLKKFRVPPYISVAERKTHIEYISDYYYVNNSNILPAIAHAFYVFLKTKSTSNIILAATDWKIMYKSLLVGYMTRERLGELFKAVRNEKALGIAYMSILGDNNAIEFLAENCYKLVNNTMFITVCLGVTWESPPIFIRISDFETAPELIPPLLNNVNNTHLLAHQR